MKSLALCSLCLEPITHPICIHCIADKVEVWLSDNRGNRRFFSSMHNWFVKSLPITAENVEHCIGCGSETEKVCCTYCYVNEMYQILKRRDWIMGEKFRIIFNYDFEDVGNDTDVHTLNYVPISEEYDENFEEGRWGGPDICDKCSNFSERLKFSNGEVVCEDCFYE